MADAYQTLYAQIDKTAPAEVRLTAEDLQSWRSIILRGCAMIFDGEDSGAGRGWEYEFECSVHNMTYTSNLDRDEFKRLWENTIAFFEWARAVHDFDCPESFQTFTSDWMMFWERADDELGVHYI